MTQQGQPPHSGIPQQMNPALAGFQGYATRPQQQPQQPPQQQVPQQPPSPGHSGIVDPYSQRPVSAQPTAWLGLTDSGIRVPVPIGPDGQLNADVCKRLETVVGPMANAHPHIVITWIEVLMALSARDGHIAARDTHIAWLQRRIEELEKKLGVEPINPQTFMQEQEAALHAAMEEEQRRQAAQANAQGGQAPNAAAPTGHPQQQAQPVPHGPSPGTTGPLMPPGNPSATGQ